MPPAHARFREAPRCYAFDPAACLPDARLLLVWRCIALRRSRRLGPGPLDPRPARPARARPEMLQRQVYRGGGPPSRAMPAARGRCRTPHGSARNPDARADRPGRGAVNRVEQLRRRVEQINGDLEVRFSQGQGPAAGAGTVELACRRRAHAIASPGRAVAMRGRRAERGAGDRRDRPASSMPPGTLVPPPRDPSGRSGHPDASRAPRRPAAVGRPTPAAGVRPDRRRAAGRLGHRAVQSCLSALLKQANYPAAEAAFKSFHRAAPEGPDGRQRAILARRDLLRARQLHGGGERLCRGL